MGMEWNEMGLAVEVLGIPAGGCMYGWMEPGGGWGEKMEKEIESGFSCMGLYTGSDEDKGLAAQAM